ncbi:hypothetical protein O769_02843 [Staphylococcus aureus M0284]|nr:hypothetical protein O769_02843 [Staphylococcus aureus M0284]
MKKRNEKRKKKRKTRSKNRENPELSFASKYRYPALVRRGCNPKK